MNNTAKQPNFEFFAVRVLIIGYTKKRIKPIIN